MKAGGGQNDERGFYATNDPFMQDPQWGVLDKKIEPNKEQKLHFEMEGVIWSQFYHGHRWHAAQIYIDKIAFTDGADWTIPIRTSRAESDGR